MLDAVPTIAYPVLGMTCDHCVRAVRDELAALDGVAAVDVELSTGRAVVTSDRPLPVEAVRAALDEAGYELAAEPTG